MAKETVTKGKFYVVDLVRKKPSTQYIEIPSYRVDVEFEVTTKGKITKPKEVPSKKMDRLKAAGMKALENYEKVIAEEAATLDKKVAALMQSPSKSSQAEAEKMIQATNAMIKNALNSAEGAAQKAITDTLKKEAQGDSLLKEARVKTTLKVTLGTIKIAGSVAKLVATSGGDVSAYKTIIVEVVKLGLEINQQLKDEVKLRKDLESGLNAYLNFRSATIVAAAKKIGVDDTSGLSIKQPLKAITEVAGKFEALGEEVTKGKSKKEIAKAVTDLVIKGAKNKLGDVEKCRKAYREHNTKTRHKTDSISASADKLMKQAKKATTLKDGVKLGAECMNIKRAATEMAKKLEEREKYLADFQELMVDAGLKIDDQTTMQKLKALDKSTILSEGKGLVGAVKTVKSLVDNIVEAAA